jgi:hypothetical protein
MKTESLIAELGPLQTPAASNALCFPSSPLSPLLSVTSNIARAEVSPRVARLLNQTPTDYDFNSVFKPAIRVRNSIDR